MLALMDRSTQGRAPGPAARAAKAYIETPTGSRDGAACESVNLVVLVVRGETHASWVVDDCSRLAPDKQHKRPAREILSRPMCTVVRAWGAADATARLRAECVVPRCAAACGELKIEHVAEKDEGEAVRRVYYRLNYIPIGSLYIVTFQSCVFQEWSSQLTST